MTFLTPSDAATLLRLSTSTLAKMRLTSRGPRFRKHGRKVVYDQADLEKWSSELCRWSTSDEVPLPETRH